jgi:hypothetical protein
MFQKTFREEIKTSILCTITCVRKSCRLRDSVKKCDRPYTPIRYMRFASCITKASHSHSEYVILIAFFTTVVITRKHLHITCIIHCPSSYLYWALCNDITFLQTFVNMSFRISKIEKWSAADQTYVHKDRRNGQHHDLANIAVLRR